MERHTESMIEVRHIPNEINELANELGFKPTKEIDNLRAQILQAEVASEGYRQLINALEESAVSLVDKKADEQYASSQLAKSLWFASIRCQMGNPIFVEDIRDAILNASNLKLSDAIMDKLRSFVPPPAELEKLLGDTEDEDTKAALAELIEWYGPQQ